MITENDTDPDVHVYTAIPEIVFCLFQLLFCACTVQVLIGGAFERGRVIPSLVFGFWWATVVYCPIACWTWNPSGWLYNLPSLDFAGGGPVHIASGWSALAYALVLGPRRGLTKKGQAHPAAVVVGEGEGEGENGRVMSANATDDNGGNSRHGRFGKARPHNTTLVFLGTTLIWFGWFGFNGGSALNASVRAMYAAFNTNTAACAGMLGWVAVDYVRHRGRFSLVGAAKGAIGGLVGITPAAGYVSLWLAAVVGFLTAVVCALMEDVNDWLRVDDGLEVFNLHGIGGMCGSFLTGLFATASGRHSFCPLCAHLVMKASCLGQTASCGFPADILHIVAALDGVTEASGAIDGNGIQVGLQLAEICAISAYSFVVSVLLLLIMKYIPGMNLRVSEEAEDMGLDMDQFFDEQIGDWSYFEEADQFRPTTTILGQVASSTTERASREDKGSSGEEVKAA